MNYLKLFFFPLLLIIQRVYLIFLIIRNFFYDLNILSEKKKNVSIISVGSLKLGGAGKTPLVEYSKNFDNNTFDVKTNKKAWISTSTSEASGEFGMDFDNIFDTYAGDIVERLGQDGLITIKNK